jgi:hypothetical protein
VALAAGRHRDLPPFSRCDGQIHGRSVSMRTAQDKPPSTGLLGNHNACAVDGSQGHTPIAVYCRFERPGERGIAADQIVSSVAETQVEV